MARKVNLRFGGQKALSWAKLPDALAVYLSLADQYSLDKLPHGFRPVADPRTGDLRGVVFWYDKKGLNESALSAFNETWFVIATEYELVRLPTEVEYYEE